MRSFIVRAAKAAQHHATLHAAPACHEVHRIPRRVEVGAACAVLSHGRLVSVRREASLEEMGKQTAVHLWREGHRRVSAHCSHLSFRSPGR